MTVRFLARAIVLSVWWLSSGSAQAAESCSVPHSGSESLDQDITIRDTGEAVRDGMVIQTGTYLRWHMRATADGYCEVRSGATCDFNFNDYRGVSRINVDATIDTLSFKGSGLYFSIFGKDDGYHNSPQVVDTHDLATSNGPVDVVLNGIGSYTFKAKNLIYTTLCPIPPDKVEEPPVTVYVHNFTNDEDLGCGRDAGTDERKGVTVGNPCNVRTGNKYQREVDAGGDVLPIVRHYNSKITDIDFGLGRGWLIPYLRRLEVYPTSTGAKAHSRRGDGYGEELTRTGTTWAAESDSNSKLIEDTTGYTLTYLTRSRDRFDLSGRLLESTDEAGTTVTLSYDANGRLSSAVDDYGHQLTFVYNSAGRISSIDRGGSVYSFTYDPAKGNLTRITYPDATTRDYLYENTSYPHHLTGIIDESGVRWGTYTYDSSGRATASQHPSSAGDVTLAYTNSSTTTVTDALGVGRTFSHSLIKGASRITAVGGTSCSWCKPSKATTYDSNANVTSRTDWNNQKTCYAYDLTRNLETVRLEGLAAGLSCPSNLVTYTPTAGTRQRKITTQWHATYPLPVQIDEPGRRTTYTYDAAGNQLTQTILDTATANSRTWTRTYDGNDRMLTIDGARTDVSDVTTYTYYSCTTGYQCGQVHTITNAAGHVTTLNAYNSDGQPLTITDPNGLVTTLTYDVRQRLATRAVGGEQITFDYWPSGLLRKVTLPDGSSLEYAYDAAHRLIEIEDSEGNRIVYTLDAMGNRTGEQVYDSFNLLVHTRTQVFDSANRLWKAIGSAGTTNVTTTFGYDNNGNQTSVAAPLGRNSSQSYDELNRLTQVTDALSGVTRYAYNTLDQAVSVTDPRNKVTNYSYNALDDLTQQVSPDTGTTTNTHDSAGNVLTSTDARNKTATYAHDSLNRLTSVSYPDQIINYTYDGGYSQKGRLTQISDSSGSTNWTYDAQGRVLSRQQSMGIIKSLGYAYDSSGRMQTFTLPSGNTIGYGYTDGKVTSLSLNDSVTILSNVLYQPFGAIRGWTWGNSTLAVRDYNTDGLITAIDSAGLHTYGYDDAFRITAINDASNSALSQSLTYDLLDRLTGAIGTSLNQSWTYDANGNRLTQGGSQSSTYSVSSSSNRLSGVSGAIVRNFAYDNAGNMTDDGTVASMYNDAGRMISATKAGTTTTYSINALGQRVKKTTGGVSRYFVHDDAGRLVGEYESNGDLIQETIWLGNIPVATIRPNGSGVSVFYLHTDHINTPRRISRPSDNAIVWRWDADPFGDSVANEDPDGDSLLLVYNMRFPGQYFDSETGVNYNYFRDYDPALGRYLQSDPIGLYGGINTYSYVGSSPLMATDWSGLDEGFDQVIGVGPLDAYTARSDAAAALQGAQQSGLPGLHNGAADAYRHCLWSCLMTQHIGADQAKTVGDTHEANGNKGGQPQDEERMDKKNNEVGRRCGTEQSPKPCADRCMDKYKMGALYGLGGKRNRRHVPGH